LPGLKHLSDLREGHEAVHGDPNSICSQSSAHVNTAFTATAALTASQPFSTTA